MDIEAAIRRHQVQELSNLLLSPFSLGIGLVEKFFYWTVICALSPEVECGRFALRSDQSGGALHELKVDVAHRALLLVDILRNTFFSHLHFVDKSED